MIINAAFVRRLIKEAGLKGWEDSARALGISGRSMRRYVSQTAAYRQPPMIVLVALKGLTKRVPPPIPGR